MIEAFIFDVDGTLIDSNDFHAEAWQKAFAEFGKSFSLDQIRPHIGKGADTLLPSFLTEKKSKKSAIRSPTAAARFSATNFCRTSNRFQKCASFSSR
jgi:beta-phosphoglucomutase-like phosphatase (HAD superfamily)